MPKTLSICLDIIFNGLYEQILIYRYRIFHILYVCKYVRMHACINYYMLS